MRCLRVKEEDRITWEDIYKHPLFGDRFSEYLKSDKESKESKAKFVLNSIRVKVASEKIELLDLFKKY